MNCKVFVTIKKIITKICIKTYTFQRLRYKIIAKGNVLMICIFPGTFNPIHDGHLKMASFALSHYKFDKVIFIPSYLPPHKEIQDNLAKHRLNMVKIATSHNPKFEVSEIEYNNKSTSYSIITVKKIIEQYKLETRLNFIIGSDAFIKLNTWYKPDEIKQLVHFIVFPRKGEGKEVIYNDFKTNGWSFEIAPMGYVNISSTGIRSSKEKIQNREIKEYIYNNGLYRT